jgi:hypothetical protein
MREERLEAEMGVERDKQPGTWAEQKKGRCQLEASSRFTHTHACTHMHTHAHTHIAQIRVLT